MGTMAAFGTYSNIVGSAPVSLGQPVTTRAAPVQTMGAPMASKSYGQPMLQTMAAMANPTVEYIQQAPMVEYMQPACQVKYVQQPRVVERAPVAPRDLKAMGNVVSEREITIEELESMDRYAATEPTTVQAPREMVVQQPQVVE